MRAKSELTDVQLACNYSGWATSTGGPILAGAE